MKITEEKSGMDPALKADMQAQIDQLKRISTELESRAAELGIRL